VILLGVPARPEDQEEGKFLAESLKIALINIKKFE